MFDRYGLKAVTMDDLAREMLVSKKTLYRLFKNKEDLVERAIRALFQEMQKRVQSVLKMPGNAIDQLVNIDEMVHQHIEEHDYSLQFQLRKYYPEVYQRFEAMRKQAVTSLVYQNIKRGQEEGLYRLEINAEIITLLYYSRMVVLIGEEIDPFKGMALKEVMREVLLYHVRGIASAQGLKYTDEKINSH